MTGKSSRRAAADFRIATFNINSINRRLDNLLRWLRQTEPDVVCLQELKTTDEAFPVAVLAEAGYGALWVGQRTWNGVAILAKGAAPIQIRRSLPGDPKDAQSRYVEAAVNGVVIACLYLPNGNPQPGPKFDYKLAWFGRLVRHAARLRRARAPAILAGDFNVVPTDADIYSPKSWKRDALLQPESHAAFRRLLKQGWLDSIRHIHPDEPIYSFWDYFRNHWERDSGLRIDHLLLNARAAALLRDAGVDREVRGERGASDHAPVWIDLRRPPAKARAKTARKRA